eukprot:5286192-Pyramimonas_sp.AAC.1
MCVQVYRYAALHGVGRRTSRTHVIQKRFGAWRHAAPPLGSRGLPGGSRAHPLTRRLSAK